MTAATIDRRARDAKHRRRRAAARAHRRTHLTVDAAAARRRLQALAVVGWSVIELADISGLAVRQLQHLRAGVPGRTRVTLVTDARVRALFWALRWRRPTSARIARVTGEADRSGWLPPCAWPADAADLGEHHADVDAVVEFYRLVDAGVSRWTADALAGPAAVRS